MRKLSRNEFMEIFPVFRNSSDSLITELLSIARYQIFPKDKVVYTEGDSCSAIAFLLSGEIRVYKIGESGREITLYEIGQGDTCILNASCILSKTTYPAHAVTTLEGEMLLMPAADFRRLIAQYEEMRQFVFTLLSQRLTSVMTLVEEIAFGRMDERLMDYIIEKSENGILYSTHQKIANDLGTSREVVSRLLKDFEKKDKVILSRNSIQLRI
jgi:CRP/FNR family transcriptional regulator